MRFIRHLVFGAVLGVSAAAQAAGYNLVSLTPAGAGSADAWDVNNVGQVVGSYGGPGFTYSRGYIWSAGVFTTLTGPAGALNLNALGVSDGGTVVGAYNDNEVLDDTGTLVLGDSHGYIYEGGSYARVDLPGALSTVLRGISANGRYVSGYGSFADSSMRGFVLDRSSGAFTLVGSNVVGAITIVQGINNLGQLVGSEIVPTSGGPVTRTSFIYDISTGIRTDQDLPGVTSSFYRDINDAGQIAGFFRVPGSQQGFVGTPASFDALAYGTENDTILEGINNSGWLVGRYLQGASGISQAMLLTPVPEPSVWLLTLAGFGVVGWQVRRRRA